MFFSLFHLFSKGGARFFQSGTRKNLPLPPHEEDTRAPDSTNPLCRLPPATNDSNSGLACGLMASTRQKPTTTPRRVPSQPHTKVWPSLRPAAFGPDLRNGHGSHGSAPQAIQVELPSRFQDGMEKYIDFWFSGCKSKCIDFWTGRRCL